MMNLVKEDNYIVGKMIDEAGNRYGRWTVIRKATKEETNNRKGGIYWFCKCDCGNSGIIYGGSLRNGDSTSCGCLQKESFSKLAKEKLFIDRTNKENINYQNCKMKIVNYYSANNVIVEFQDNHHAKVHCAYRDFLAGSAKNPYYPEIYSKGIIGQKYKTRLKNKEIKEYKIWRSMLQRCYDEKTKERHKYYKDVTCCEEWLLFENFYEWLHGQENFDKWLNGKRWAIDKDILIKGNKIYSPNTCCLVPPNVNSLFTKRDKCRGDYPIGVYYNKRNCAYKAQCNNPLENNKRVGLGQYNSENKAFYLGYKPYKENMIKQIAQYEYDKNNITKKCYDAMMGYQVEITD